MYIYFNKPFENIQTPVSSEVSSKTQETPKEVPTQVSQNETLNLQLIYQSNCTNSTKKYVETIGNITDITLLETRFFDNKKNAEYYLSRNWSTIFYTVEGMKRDITDKTAVSVFEIKSVGERNFTLPILCDENGKIGNYSSCLLKNIPNIPAACFNFTINLTDCEIEWYMHTILEDIQYWITPPGAALIIGSSGTKNKTQTFNFTIYSSRKRLEYFGMNIIERTFTPIIIDSVIFSSNKMTSDGRGGSIIKEVNITDKKNVEFYATIWFKKKCYDKYVIY